MNHPQYDAFTQWLTGQCDACAARRAALFADHRVDESNFEKIRENVYDIFRTVFTAARKTQGDDPAMVHLFFLQKLEEIPACWRASLEKARDHGDEDKIHLEQLKLEAAERIKAEYLRLQEGAL